MHAVNLHRARIVASVAATVIALACGTNYVYSAWAPQFAEKLKLSSTESNLIGLFGNLGMYTCGVPIGMFIDHRGPRPAVLAGSLLLAIGYFPLHQAYDRGIGSVPALCVFSYLSGLGGCMAFAASVKTSALNWPHHRGTATAFPLAAFGLSAFFFSLFGSIFFPGDPSKLLLLLACGTCGMTFIGFFFLKVYPPPAASQQYQAVPHQPEELDRPQVLRRTSSEELKRHRAGATVEPGTSDAATSSPLPLTPISSNEPLIPHRFADEESSLDAHGSASEDNVNGTSHVDFDRSHRVDIRGLKLLQDLNFWQFFLIMAILAGVGVMTINNIGNNAKALWEHYDESVTEPFLVKRQQMHVSILSACSFLGRLGSGVGSDFLVKRLHASRVWCLAIACLIFFIAQVCALNITTPQWLVLVSGLSGLGYGFLFGVFPSIVAESFGIKGLSQNWGFMTLAPVISSNIFNLFYGQIYDRHSVRKPSGESVCLDGLQCYQAAYWVTFGACFLGVGVVLWVIRYQHVQHTREVAKASEED